QEGDPHEHRPRHPRPPSPRRQRRGRHLHRPRHQLGHRVRELHPDRDGLGARLHRSAPRRWGCRRRALRRAHRRLITPPRVGAPRPGPPPRRRTAMNTIHDEARETLKDYMTGALGRVIAGLDALDELTAQGVGRMADRDDWGALGKGVQDLLVDLGVEPDDEFGEWDLDDAMERVREALDPLSVTYEKGEPFDVALTIGGPNIYLVDFGGHGWA